MESYGPKWRFTDGEAVFRKTIDVPAHLAGKDLFISVGRVDEHEATYFNGERVGGDPALAPPARPPHPRQARQTGGRTSSPSAPGTRASTAA
jgi:hypothetical protein